MDNVLVGTTEHDRQNLVLGNQAVRKVGWLPRGLWPTLDELAERHEDAVAALAVAGEEAQALGAKFKAEDEARIEAYKTGLDAPKMTDPAERERVTAEARAKVHAAKRELGDAVAAAIEGVQAHADEWLGDLTRQRSDAEAKREEAKRLLERAYQGLGQIKATEHWIERTARNANRDHLAHSEVPVGQPYDPREDLAAIMGELGGDTAPTVVGA